MTLAHSAHRVAVLSDVHGNAVALEAVLAELRDERPDLVIFGGDLTWGPLPEQTLALVDDLDIRKLFVRGNADRALLEPRDETASGQSCTPHPDREGVPVGAARGASSRPCATSRPHESGGCSSGTPRRHENFSRPSWSVCPCM